METAATYVRKSTDQSGVAEDQRSIARQVEHARIYAKKKGWVIPDEFVFADDGVSGAELDARPGFVRLMNSLKPKPQFEFLVMAEESRLGRESIETSYALKQLVQAGVRVFFYMEDRERVLENPIDKIMLSLTTFADELERVKARQRTYDAMERKARAGHVTGGRVFGYDNIEVTGADGTRSHVLRQINEAEAVVVRRIFELCAAGTGYTRTAKLLNAEGAPCPRPQRARPAGWAPSSVNEILHRSLYRGEIVWNKTRKRDQWGQQRQAPRPREQWMQADAPHLRIVTDAQWNAAHERLKGIRERLMTVSGGRIGARARDIESHYLLPGFARCGVCGGGLCVMTRSHGRRRVPFYGCMAHHKRGKAVCTNITIVSMETLDAAVLATIGGEVLRPAVVSAVVAGVLDAMSEPDPATKDRDRLAAELVALNREAAGLTEAVASGGQLEPLIEALQGRQERRRTIEARLADLDRPALPRRDRKRIEADVRGKLEDWRALLTRHVQDGRDLLRRLLVGPLRVWPIEGQARAFRFEGTGDLWPLLIGVAGLATLMASPSIPSWNQTAEFLKTLQRLRDACGFAA